MIATSFQHAVQHVDISLRMADEEAQKILILACSCIL